MSLVSLEELPECSVRSGERGKKDIVRQFLGRSNNPYDRQTAIEKSSLCPKVGQRDLYDVTAVIVDVEVRRAVTDAPSSLWHVSYTASTDYDEDQGTSPLQLPAEFSWYAEQHDRYTEVDIRKKRIVTSAGTVIPQKVEDSRWIVSVRKNLKRVPTALLQMNNSLNNASVSIDGIPFPKQTVMCKGIRIGPEQKETFNRQRIAYREVSFQLHYRREGWKARTPDVDFVEKRYGKFRVKNKDGTYKRTKDGKNFVYREGWERVRILIGDPKEYVTDPWPLAADGTKLPEDYQPEDVRMIESDVYFPKDFGILPLR